MGVGGSGGEAARARHDGMMAGKQQRRGGDDGAYWTPAPPLHETRALSRAIAMSARYGDPRRAMDAR